MRLARSATVATLLLAACATRPPATPPRPPAPLPPPPPVARDWRDLPLDRGGWHYTTERDGSSASFGPPGAPPDLVLRCRRAAGTVTLQRSGASATLTVRTSASARTLAAVAGTATLRATDTFLDEITFSRGRFTVESPDAALLVAPAWAEPGRVIEDCRAPAGPG